MKFVKSVAVLALSVFAGFISMSAIATPIFPVQDAFISIQKNPATLGTTAVADPFGPGNLVSSISYGGGSINLSDLNTNSLLTANPVNPNDWWHGSGVVYTTTTNTINITFTDLLVNAFTFKLGANMNANGWIKAYYETDTGSASLLTAPGLFSINNLASDTYGVYVKEPNVSCALITRIEIEPTFVWGVGDFGISTGGCSSDVPEPNTVGLLFLGLTGMGLAFYGPRRRPQVQQS